MRASVRFILVALLGAVACSAAAQSPSPYIGLEGRDLKAVAPERVQGLLAAQGMGYALTAELNGHPGPMHVLELAEQLKLTSEQAQRTRAIMDSMKGEGRVLGARLVDAETHLERMFRMRHIDQDQLRAQTATIGAIEADLRRAHLAAHLHMLEVLTPEQVEAYGRLRGYGDAGAQRGHHGHGGSMRH